MGSWDLKRCRWREFVSEIVSPPFLTRSSFDVLCVCCFLSLSAKHFKHRGGGAKQKRVVGKKRGKICRPESGTFFDGPVRGLLSSTILA